MAHSRTFPPNAPYRPHHRGLAARAAFAAAALLLFAPVRSFAQPDIRGLGVTWTSEYLINTFHASITPNGRAVAFTAIVDRHRAHRWTEADGAQLLPLPPADNLRKLNESFAYDISSDGLQIVGNSVTATWDSACIWNLTDQPLALADGQVANAISADGTAIVGTGGAEPILWLNKADAVSLPMPTDAIRGIAAAVSANGSTIAGSYQSRDGNFHPVVWLDTEAPIDLADGLDEALGGYALAVSANGDTAVGWILQRGQHVFRWRAAGGTTILPQLANDRQVVACAVSDDGDTVVGFDSRGGTHTQARIWKQDGSCRDLTAYLRGIGAIGINGWQLLTATDISSDGTVIVGLGRNPAGLFEHFVARIAPLCLGDVNADQVTDLSDLAVVLTYFGKPSEAVRIEGDLDDDGAVDIADLLQVIANFGSHCE